MNKVLKKNDYKCVELHEKFDGSKYISKRYSGHSVGNLTSNTEYIYAALHFFYERFSEILDCPRPYTIDLERFQVQMEYLPDLPSANRLTFRTLHLADDFFHKCYAIREDFGFLRSIRNSVVTTSLIDGLLDEGFPLSLGLKGDLSENLCFGGKRLILADIDSLSLEPLGLSELLLHIELYASLRSLPRLAAQLMSPPIPVAFQYLDKSEAQQVIIAAQEILDLKMKSLTFPARVLKRLVSKKSLSLVVGKFYH
jgi:hypothetical protein